MGIPPKRRMNQKFFSMRPPPATAARLSSNRSTTSERTVSRTEWLWLFGAILFGAVLRLSFPGRMAIEHFDEGVYASNFWFDVEQGGEYPARHLYAPPLLPMAIEWTMIVVSLCGIRPTGFVPMIPSLIAGLVTIPSLWWIGRRWFGPSAGIVAAWLVAASDFHASYSRAALTDVPVGLFMLWGVYFLWQALQTGTRRDIVLAGLFTGLAWWTKYNGWLPLAIGLSGGAAWQLFLPRTERNVRQFATRWMLIALTAFVIWSPVLWGLQKHGGYAAVAANHRQYVVGLKGWRSSALRQLHVVGLYENWFGAIHEIDEELRNRSIVENAAAGPLPLTAPSLPINVPQQYWRHGEFLSNLSKGTLSGATLSLLWVVSLFALTVGFVRILERDRGSPRDLCQWLVAAWLIGLTFATPMYHPYPRLMLPWLMACWIGVGVAAQLWWERGREVGDAIHTRFATWQPTRLELLALVSLIALGTVRPLAGTAHLWRDRSQYQVASRQIADKIQGVLRDKGFPANEAIVYVLGEPAIVHGLRSSGLPLTVPIQDLSFTLSTQVRPTFFVFSQRSFQSTAFADEWDRQRQRFTSVLTPRVLKSHLVRFDEPGNPRESNPLVEYRSSLITFYAEQFDR